MCAQVDFEYCSQNRTQFKLRGEKAAGLRVIWCKFKTAELSITEVKYGHKKWSATFHN